MSLFRPFLESRSIFAVALLILAALSGSFATWTPNPDTEAPVATYLDGTADLALRATHPGATTDLVLGATYPDATTDLAAGATYADGINFAIGATHAGVTTNVAAGAAYADGTTYVAENSHGPRAFIQPVPIALAAVYGHVSRGHTHLSTQSPPFASGGASAVRAIGCMLYAEAPELACEGTDRHSRLETYRC